MTMTALRRPSASSRSITRCWYGTVVVSKAESPTICGLQLSNDLDDAVGAHVLADVVHVEPARAEHRPHHVLAEVVQVALDRGEHDDRVGLGVAVALGEQRGLDDRVAPLEHLGAGDDLGQEHLAALPHLAEVEHRDGHALLEDPLRVGARIDEALRRRDAEVEVRGDQRALEDFEVFLHRPDPSGSIRVGWIARALTSGQGLYRGCFVGR